MSTGHKIRFAGAERGGSRSSAGAGDIAVGAVLEITAPNGQKATATPVYLIRGNQPFSLKDEAPEFGLHFRFENIDPKAGALTIGIAQASNEQRKIPVEIAEGIARSDDNIVLEAILFPGINLVWICLIMMMLGLGIALWRRLSQEV